MDVDLRQGLEALLFVVEEPVDTRTLAETLEADESAVEETLIDLAAAYEREQRGLTIRRGGGGWRMYTAEAAAPAVEAYVLSGRSGRLTQAALETLAVVAYKQPISRQDVSEIRGVNADGAMRSLVARGYLEEVGRDEGPGQAILYGTTTQFLERLGIDDVDQLPPLTDYLPEQPAPDEPDLGHLRDARRHLAAGSELPSTGRGHWAPSEPSGDTREDDDEAGDADQALPPPGQRESMRAQDEEMDELTGALERAARSAMRQLREAVAATDDDSDDEEPAGEADAEADDEVAQQGAGDE